MSLKLGHSLVSPGWCVDRAVRRRRCRLIAVYSVQKKTENAKLDAEGFNSIYTLFAVIHTLHAYTLGLGRQVD